jgi:hypothetical protein
MEVRVSFTFQPLYPNETAPLPPCLFYRRLGEPNPEPVWTLWRKFSFRCRESKTDSGFVWITA